MREDAGRPRRGLAWAGVSVAGLSVAASLGLASGAFPGGQLGAALFSQGLWIGLAVAATALRSLPLRSGLGLTPLRASRAAMWLWVIGFCALSLGLSWILRWSALDEGGSLGLLAQLLRDLRGIGVLFAVVALGIGPGIGEELFFRGFLQPMIGEHWRRAAIPLAAGAFALAHVDPVHAAAAFPLGLYLGALRYCTGSTLGAILAHAANNSLAVLGATLSGWVLLASILFLILAVAFGIRLIQAGRQPTFPDRELQP